MQTHPYYTFRQYMIDRYNKPLYSIPIDLDLGCPNRLEDGSGGCTFCPSNGARAAQTLDASSVQEQIKVAIEFARYRYKAQKFMLYIQAYTGTFTSVMNQKKMYSSLLKEYAFDAISIGTRPDCLNTKTLEYLQELNEQIDVHVDLGVQTLNDNTLQHINRGHDSQCSLEAIRRLKEYGIKVFAHIIVGLPNESRKDWENSVKQLVECNIDGIKIHNLHIIKDTQLAQEYLQNPFKLLNEYEYANEVIHLIRHVPSHIPIIRISTDTPKEQLLAPLWHMQKGQFSEYVLESMIYQDIQQADLIASIAQPPLKKENTFTLEDGSMTIWDSKYKDYYHPKSGAIKSANELFIKQSQLLEKLQQQEVYLLDIGFGMGYNSLEALKLPKSNHLFITALDKNRHILRQSKELLDNKEDKNILSRLYEEQCYDNNYNHIELILDDARHSVQKLEKKYDIIFLDPFIHTQNPSLITKEFVQLLTQVLKPDGIVICSCNIDASKSAFSQNGFNLEICDIEKTDIKGFKAFFGSSKNEGLCYEDPYLVYREKQIITSRENRL